MSASDERFRLLIDGQEFLTDRQEALDDRVRALEMGRAASDGRNSVMIAVFAFASGIGGSILTAVLIKWLKLT